MSITKSLSFDEICQRGSIRDADVSQLRKLFYEDSNVSHEEAEALFEINDACRVQDPTWAPFFVEAVTDYIINEVDPKGYLTVDNADWLISHISRDGRVETQTELELLINVLDKARWTPERLVRFALEQIEFAVLHGNGPLRAGKELAPGCVTSADVELLRRAIYAFGGEGNVSVTRSEAEVLFRINDATAEANNVPEWQELFVKAIANAVMAASGYRVPSRAEALRRERWLEERGDLSIGSMLSAIGRGGIQGIRAIYSEQSAEERAIARLEQQRIEIITNEEVTGGEVEWLVEQIGRDGRMTANEKALIAFLKAESTKLHPSLDTLLDRLEDAA
ncbi:MAG: hypothetical protein KDJ36_07905 [Hyphomicrobiaceae bacterium]|nr:hypothetical protein [Hyphomicrobiaceae bacterium]